MLAAFEKYDRSMLYMNSSDSEKFIRDLYAKEKVLMERLGLAMKA